MVLGASCDLLVAIWRCDVNVALVVAAIFAQQNAIAAKPAAGCSLVWIEQTTQELLMEYVIFAGLGTMMVLYAVIIIECLRHPEW